MCAREELGITGVPFFVSNGKYAVCGACPGLAAALAAAAR
jgi:predicted DsbA family dithiol-disulfide isomerase